MEIWEEITTRLTFIYRERIFFATTLPFMVRCSPEGYGATTGHVAAPSRCLNHDQRVLLAIVGQASPSEFCPAGTPRSAPL
jgi:hypothetical protein